MAKGDFTNNDRVKTDIPVYLAPISQEEFKELLDAIEGLWWQFARKGLRSKKRDILKKREKAKGRLF